MPLEYRPEDTPVWRRRPFRVLIALCGVVAVTFLGYKVIPKVAAQIQSLSNSC